MTEEELGAIEEAFEATIHYPSVANYIVPLIAEVRRLRAVLVQVEHGGRLYYNGHDSRCCPVCGRGDDEQHAPDCTLAAALGK